MLMNICGMEIESEEIRDITITDSYVLIDTKEEYYRLRYTSQEETVDAIMWQRMQKLTEYEVIEAVNVLVITCSMFINQKEQCSNCPLKKKNGCVFTSIPIDWRN